MRYPGLTGRSSAPETALVACSFIRVFNCAWSFIINTTFTYLQTKTLLSVNHTTISSTYLRYHAAIMVRPLPTQHPHPSSASSPSPCLFSITSAFSQNLTSLLPSRQ